MRRSGHRSHYSPSKPSRSYEIVEETPTYEQGRLYSQESEVNDDDIMDGLLELIKSVKKQKKKKFKERYEKEYEREDTSYHEDDQSSHENEELQRSLKEREYIHQEQKHIQKVHKELCDINEKLQHENKRLRQWDLELRKREAHLDSTEARLTDYAGSIEEIIQKSVTKQCQELEEACEQKIQQTLHDSKKTQNSFKIVKKANDSMKKQLENDKIKMAAYEEKQTALQNRIVNLQRKNEIIQQQLKEEQSISSSSIVREKAENVSRKRDQSNVSLGNVSTSAFYEVFSTLLQWVADIHLKQNINNTLKVDHNSHSEHDVIIETINERCMKILISLPHVLQDVSNMSEAIQLSFINFTYWSLLHSHLTQSSQRFTHSATYRRIGEELYHSPHGKTVKSHGDTSFDTSYFTRSNARIRILSSLIILHTVSKADIMANIFRCMSTDLRHEQSKDIFIENHGTVFLLPLFKLTNKIHLYFTTDLLMILATESPSLQPFLTSLGSVEWIQGIISVMKTCQDDVPLMEKLSLLLQRLSKLRTNKTIFDALQVYNVISELNRTCDPTEEFLQLNLRSILFNIDSMKSN